MSNKTANYSVSDVSLLEGVRIELSFVSGAIILEFILSSGLLSVVVVSPLFSLVFTLLSVLALSFFGVHDISKEELKNNSAINLETEIRFNRFIFSI